MRERRRLCDGASAGHRPRSDHQHRQGRRCLAPSTMTRTSPSQTSSGPSTRTSTVASPPSPRHMHACAPPYSYAERSSKPSNLFMGPRLGASPLGQPLDRGGQRGRLQRAGEERDLAGPVATCGFRGRSLDSPADARRWVVRGRSRDCLFLQFLGYGASATASGPKKPTTRRILPSLVNSTKSTLSAPCVPSLLSRRQLNRATR